MTSAEYSVIDIAQEKVIILMGDVIRLSSLAWI